MLALASVPTYLDGMADSKDAGGRRRTEKQVVRNGKTVKANVWGVERAEPKVTLEQALHDSGFVTFGGQIANPSDSVEAKIESEAASRADSTNEARALLDHWEHYDNHPEFIKEVGGREAYDAEMSRRFDVFMTLNTNSSPADVARALAELKSINLENR